MDKSEKIAKAAKLGKGVLTLAGVAGIALFTIYWFDLDDALIKKVEPKLKAKAEAYQAQKAAAEAAAQE
jgi:hypothetical protein